jgi:hypothetical protein
MILLAHLPPDGTSTGNRIAFYYGPGGWEQANKNPAIKTGFLDLTKCIVGASGSP